jgi:hypothetical protein
MSWCVVLAASRSDIDVAVAGVHPKSQSPRPSLGRGLFIGADAVRIEGIALYCCHQPDKLPPLRCSVDGVVNETVYCRDAQKKAATGSHRSPQLHSVSNRFWYRDYGVKLGVSVTPENVA